MRITYVDALNTILPTVTDTAVAEKLTALRDTLMKRQPSDEAKEKQNTARKAATAAKRAEMVGAVAPILRKYLAADITAKDLFEVAKGELPTDFSPSKVQNILIREMAPELVKTETKGRANTYRLI